MTMRLTAKLVHVAAIVAAASGCGGATTATAPDGGGDGGPTTDGASPVDSSTPDDGGNPIDGGNPYDTGNPVDGSNPGDGGNPGDGSNPGDAAPDGVIGCGGCGCGGDGAPPPTVTVTAAQACSMLEETHTIGTFAFGQTCQAACAEAGGFAYVCELPQSYANEVQSLNPDGGSTDPDGGAWTLDCPTSPATLMVTCTMNCVGRLTDGYSAPEGMRDEGERLAAMAYLEAVSVHAFERLERELDAHRAPPTLLREARRARRDEVRHTAMTTRLARRHGASPRRPEAPAQTRLRTLFEVALENAVEGCIRETYGAVQGLVEAQTSRDATMRRAMQSLATDECRHAELAWAVHAWAMPRLTDDERRAVERAMKDAIAEIAARDPRTASLLFSRSGMQS
jgi:hypothetical protein